MRSVLKDNSHHQIWSLSFRRGWRVEGFIKVGRGNSGFMSNIEGITEIGIFSRKQVTSLVAAEQRMNLSYLCMFCGFWKSF